MLFIIQRRHKYAAKLIETVDRADVDCTDAHGRVEPMVEVFALFAEWRQEMRLDETPIESGYPANAVTTQQTKQASHRNTTT